jgi:hypothetical protein
MQAAHTFAETESFAGSQARVRYLYMVVLVAAVGGFLFGYDLSLISGAIVFLKEEFSLSPFWFGAVAGIAKISFAAVCGILRRFMPIRGNSYSTT